MTFHDRAIWHCAPPSGWLDRLPGGSDVAIAEAVHHSVVNELLRLTLLAPDIVERFLDGRQPRRLTLMWFQRQSLPVDWDAQRALVASFEGAR